MESRLLELIGGNRNVPTRKFSDNRTVKVLSSCVSSSMCVKEEREYRYE